MLKSLSNPKKKDMLLSKIEQVMNSSHYSEGQVTKEAQEAITKLYKDWAGVALECKLVANAGAGLSAISNVFLKSKGKLKVAVQNNTFFATGFCFKEHYLYLLDSKGDCPSMSLESLKAMHNKVSLDLVVITHIGGWIAKDYVGIAKFCRDNSILLVEDCAHSFGVFGNFFESTPATLGDLAVFSFYPTKAIPIGEGGAVLGKDSKLLDAVYRYCNYGKEYNSVTNKVEYVEGFNLRMSEFSAAILLTQVHFIEDILLSRYNDYIKLSMKYNCLLKGCSNYYKFPVASDLNVPSELIVGSVYSRSDQLDNSLSNIKGLRMFSTNLSNSHNWATAHKCIYIGEGVHPEDSNKFMTPKGLLVEV